MEDTSVLTILLTAALAALPGIVISLWNGFKIRAEQTPEKWDDEVVRFIEDIASRVVDQKNQ